MTSKSGNNKGNVKGQTSLFSFFKKPVTEITNDHMASIVTPSSLHENVSEGKDGSSMISSASVNLNPYQHTSSSHENAKKYSDNPSNHLSFNDFSAKKGILESPKKRMLIDDAEISSADINTKKKVESVKKPRKIIADDEEEWLCEDSDDDKGSDMIELSDDDDDDDCLPMKKKAKAGGRLSKAKDTKKSSPITMSKPPLPKPVSQPSPAMKPPSSYAHTPIINRDQCSSTSMNSYHYITPSPSMTMKTTQESSSSPASSFDPYPSSLSPLSSSMPSSSSEMDVSIVPLPEGVMGRGSHEHNTFPFLLPHIRRDKHRRSSDDADYDARTLHVPDTFMKDQTPAMVQWWQFKSDNMDTILFFKVGKFYELFHMDADVGMAELDLIYMKGAKAHSGFPEVSYGKFASILVSKGYRVARVEQTETPEMLKERNDHSNKKKDKVVRRELCSIMSKGTRTYCHLDDLSMLDRDQHDGHNSMLICILERCYHHKHRHDDHKRDDDDHNDDDGEMMIEYGICCVDTVLGNVTIGQFQDDEQRCRLRTFLLHHQPSEVLLLSSSSSSGDDDKSCLSNIINIIAPKALITYMRSCDIPSPSSTLNMMHDSKYFVSDNIMIAKDIISSSSSLSPGMMMPDIIEAASHGISSGSSDMLMSALGSSIMHLKRSLIDYEIMSMKKIYAYVPPDEQQINHHHMIISDDDNQHPIKASFQPDGHHITSSSPSSKSMIRHMTIDAIALSNLEILVNNYDHKEDGSLYAYLSYHCQTSFGKRLLKSWICHPLYHPDDISYRSDAVDEFIINPALHSHDMMKAYVSTMHNIPDLERLLSRIHSNSIMKKAGYDEDHPDKRAVMYESSSYNARKIKDFADILSGFESCVKIGYMLHEIHHHPQHPIQSSLLKKITSLSVSSGKFCYDEMERLLSYYRDIFDEKQAKKDGYIRPKPGVNPSYDAAKLQVHRIEAEFEAYLCEMKTSYHITDMKYFGSNKDRYQLEVPMNAVQKIPSTWMTKSQKKTHRRYWTSWIEDKMVMLMQAEERLVVAQDDTIRQIFARFDEKYHLWHDAVTCMATLDAIYSLAMISKHPGYVRPVISLRCDDKHDDDDMKDKSDGDCGAYIHIKQGRHPMLEHAMLLRGDDSSYIPNSLTLGGLLPDFEDASYSPKLLLLTGPNMGGKSTLLRQTCLLAIMAQVGCRVPADSCIMTSVDRIFTRIGASDRILSGQSTFFVELAETAMILKYASPDSICIIDELGRGTATFDGTAIAHAVLHHLININRSRILFATHYHSLVDDWSIDPRVSLGHMDCLVQPSPDDAHHDHDDVDDVDAEVTFLYKLCPGTSPRSYGINVAKLARLPSAVIDLAIKQSIAFETSMRDHHDDDHQHDHIQMMMNYHERLVSIIHSNMTSSELAYVAKELWHRYQAAK